MKKQLIFLFAIFFTYSLHGQSKLDSLFKQLKKHTKEDSLHVDLLIKIGIAYDNVNNKLAIQYFKKALELGSSISGIKKYLARLYGYVGQTYNAMNDVENSLYYNLEAATLSLSVGDSNNYLYALNNIANAYLSVNEFKEGLEYIHKELAVLPGVTNTTLQLAHFSTMANLLMMDNQLDSGYYYLKKGLALCLKYGDWESAQFNYVNIGQYFYDVKKYDSALYYYRKALDVGNTHQGFASNKISAYNLLGQTYISFGNIKFAKIMLDSAENLALDLNSMNGILFVYQDKAVLYKQLKDFKQYAFYNEKYYQLKDSFKNADMQSEWNQIE